MNAQTYINCLNSRGIFTGVTGSVAGIYDFSGVSGNKLVWNQVYVTGLVPHFISGQINASVYPLISRNPGGNITPVFTGQQRFSFGEKITGDYGVLLDLDYNGCIRTTSGKDYVLLSTMPNLSGQSSGFYVGINEANRLYIEYSGGAETVPYELKRKNLVHLSVSNRKYLKLGVFDVLTNRFVNTSVELQNELPTENPLYLGGFLNETNAGFTGYSGLIQHAVLYNEPVELDILSGCVDCLFVTGIVPSTGTQNILVPVITGFEEVTLITTGITGYRDVSGNVLNSAGVNIPIFFQSGVTGALVTQTLANLKTGSVQVTQTGFVSYSYRYDIFEQSRHASYSVEFENDLFSGDYVEIYTYPKFNPYVNKTINEFRDWPNESGVQLVGNGLIETSGVDYYVTLNKITGFYSDDILRYDLVTGQRYVLPYSGLWSRSKIAISGGTFFPTAAQFLELPASGAIAITGISGNMLSGYDVYLNGQKLISGVDYSRPLPGASGHWILLSGSGLPDFTADIVSTGSATGIINIDDSEIAFIPAENSPRRWLFKISGNASGNLVPNITGFSEQIWVNGIRQSIDYQLNFACSFQSGVSRLGDLLFNFYNNEGSYFNIT